MPLLSPDFQLRLRSCHSPCCTKDLAGVSTARTAGASAGPSRVPRGPTGRRWESTSRAGHAGFHLHSAAGHDALTVVRPPEYFCNVMIPTMLTHVFVVIRRIRRRCRRLHSAFRMCDVGSRLPRAATPFVLGPPACARGAADVRPLGGPAGGGQAAPERVGRRRPRGAPCRGRRSAWGSALACAQGSDVGCGRQEKGRSTEDGATKCGGAP